MPNEKARPPRAGTRSKASASKASVIDLSDRTPPRRPSGFAAQIEGASIADLIQLECTRGLTRAVRISAGDETGYLYFDQGDIVHAVAGQLRGEPAAREILTWEGGTVRPSDSYWVNPPTIEMSWQALLISAAQQKDEAERADSEIVTRSSLEKHRQAPAPPEQETQVEAKTPKDLTRIVVLNEHGELTRSAGDVGDFADAAAYCVRLAQLIGTELGLEDFRGFESVGNDKTMIAYVDGESTVALEAKTGTPLESYRKKAGL